MQFQAVIENGKPRIETPQSYKRYLEGFNEGEKIVIDIEKKKNKRSLSQNSYYWIYLGVIENETGNTASDLHELFKRKFLLPQEKTILGQQIKLPASTTNLSKHDFSEYLDRICALTGVPIPDPTLAGYTTGNDYVSAPKTNYPTEEWKEPTI